VITFELSEEQQIAQSTMREFAQNVLRPIAQKSDKEAKADRDALDAIWSTEIIQAQDESYRQEIKDTTAGLVIGDRALEQRKISTFIYDLGSEWRAITGLPFVFAAWVSTKPLPPDFIRLFDEANGLGLEHIDEIVASTAFDIYDLKKYYTLHLSYHLDERKRRGMERFLQIIGQGDECSRLPVTGNT